MDVPAPHRPTARLLDEREHAARGFDVAGLRTDNEDGVGPRHRDDLHVAAEAAIVAPAQRRFHCGCKILRVARVDGQDRVGLVRKHVDIERVHKIDQRLPRPRFAADEHGITRLIGGDLGARADELLQHLRQLFRRRVAQRNRDDPRRSGAARRDAAGSIRRDDAIKAITLHEPRAVLGEQRLKRRQQRRARHRTCRMQGRGAMHGRIDRVVDLQQRAENLRRDLANVGVGEVEHDVAGRRFVRRRRRGEARRGAERYADRRGGWWFANRPADAHVGRADLAAEPCRFARGRARQGLDHRLNWFFASGERDQGGREQQQ